MKRIIGLGTLLAISVAIMGCDSAVSNTNTNANANLRGTNTNTGYMAPTNVTPEPVCALTYISQSRRIERGLTCAEERQLISNRRS